MRELVRRPEIGSLRAPMEKAKDVLVEKRRGQTSEQNLEKEPTGRSFSSSEARVEKISEQKARGLQIPADFRCPLSLELMSDPVIVASGQTYERAYIQRWLDQGNTTCPKTRQTLTHTNLIPNYTVKALIANWCEANEVPLHVTSNADILSFSSQSLKPLASVESGSTELGEEHLSRTAPHESVATQKYAQERGMSGIGSRPPPKARHSFQTISIHDQEFMGNGLQNGAAGSGETSKPILSCGSEQKRIELDMSRRLGIFSMKDKNDTFNSEREPSIFREHHHRTDSSSSVVSTVEEDQGFCAKQHDIATANAAKIPVHSSPHEINVSAEMEVVPNDASVALTEESRSPCQEDRMVTNPWTRRDEEREECLPRIVTNLIQDTTGVDGNTQEVVEKCVLGLGSDDVDVQRHSAAKLRLLAKYSMENRIIIANSGAIGPLVSLLKSTDPKIQENSVTALLNLSINDNNKTEIAAAGAIEPLVNVLKIGNAQAMENAAATLFSLSVMDDNKVSIGASGAIPPLVHLLMNGTPRGKKDAATALFNLSIFHENKVRIVRAGAIKPLVELMADPAAGMVDKAVAVLANLATIPEGRVAIGEEGGIPALVEVVEAGSQRGKENAAAALLQLCMNSHKHRALVLQEGAIPPLVSLSQSGTARAKEKASALLRHFREQRHQVLGPRPGVDKQMMGQY